MCGLIRTVNHINKAASHGTIDCFVCSTALALGAETHRTQTQLRIRVLQHLKGQSVSILSVRAIACTVLRSLLNAQENNAYKGGHVCPAVDMLPA